MSVLLHLYDRSLFPMRLTEYEGKELFISHGINVPHGEIVKKGCTHVSLKYPIVLKSQLPVSDRKARGGIIKVNSQEQFFDTVETLFSLPIDGETPLFLLAEEYIEAAQEIYVSFSYSSETRAPMLALSAHGGSGISQAFKNEIDPLQEFNSTFVEASLQRAGIAPSGEITETILKLWSLFSKEKLILAEINPLFVLSSGKVIAGDSKVVRDDSLLPPVEKQILPLGGDIAIIASGGGASMLNIDVLMRAGGKPANYVEYSGNPPASVVEALTVRVLSQPSLRGAWVIGGTANFTDTYETMTGFVNGLRQINPKPAYPIVVRRDGPRLAEARAMLERVARDEGYNLYVYGAEISMAESAKILLSKI